MNVKNCLRKIAIMIWRFGRQQWYKKYSKQRVNMIDAPRLTGEEIASIKKYWGEYSVSVNDCNWHRYLYALTNIKSPEFVPENIFHLDVLPYFNQLNIYRAWTDKSYLSIILGDDIPTPKQIITNINGQYYDGKLCAISKFEARRIVSDYKKLVIKPTIDSGEAKGVELIDSSVGGINLDNIERDHESNFTVQVPVKQHKTMNILNSSSVNTMRITTMMWKGEFYLLSSFLRVGQEGSFADNEGTNRCFVGVDESGHLSEEGVSYKYQKVNKCPNGVAFSGFTIPGYEYVYDLLKKAHGKFTHFRLVFWDVCIQENGHPLIIEANLCGPDVGILQSCCGPFFNKLSRRLQDEILSSISTASKKQEIIR